MGAGGNQELEMAAVTTGGANVMDGTKLLTKEQGRTDSPAAAKVVGKKKFRSRSTSASSQDSYSSSGSYSGIHRFIIIYSSPIVLERIYGGRRSR